MVRLKNIRALNFIPLHEVREITKLRSKKRPEYTLKKIVPINFRSDLKSSVKNRNEYNDYDYLYKLNDKDKEWLTKFHREYLNSDFKSYKKPLHKNKKLKRTCYDMNNCRNRDIFSQKRVMNKLKFLGDDVHNLICDKNYIDKPEKV